MAKAKLTQQEKDDIKAQNKAWRQEMLQLARAHQDNPPVYPWTLADKVGMTVVGILAIIVCIALYLMSR